MPLLRLQTSASVADDDRKALLGELSAKTAALLSKPEAYMMVVIEASVPMLMGGSEAPTALIEVRSVGTISADQARALSEALSGIVGERLGLAPDRVYSNFKGVEGSMWGYGGRTFG